MNKAGALFLARRATKAGAESNETAGKMESLGAGGASKTIGPKGLEGKEKVFHLSPATN